MSKRFFSIILCVLTIIFCIGCHNTAAPTDGDEPFVVGFSQLGSESDWRIANTKSMMETFTNENGYVLVIENAKQQQNNQLAAVRNFILEDVDCIVIAPLVEGGWKTVLTEAHNAGIPVILMDRTVSVNNDDLYLTHIGSDFLNQGNQAVEWLESETKNTVGDKLHILHLQGTYGSTAQLLRTKALEIAVATHESWEFTAQLYGDFTEAKGYEAVADFLKTRRDIDVIYSENDNMTFGAMRALDDAGISYGTDGKVKIITFDATKEAMQLCLDGKINLCVECNPLHGPRVEQLIRQYRDGKEIPKQIYVDEAIYTQDDLTQEFIDNRKY